MSRLDELKANFRYVLREEGPQAAAERFKVHARNYLGRFKKQPAPRDDMNDYVDVLFINGCDYSVPHPVRYRVDHQMEQLESAGMTTRKVDAWNLTEDHVRLARTFVIFRCPYWDFIEHFVNLAHQLNKRVLYDIDDLVIDTVYTDQIKYLDTMTPEERAGYDDGVRRMGQTMRLCDGVITTTDELARELRRYMGTVFVNRNVASEEMLALSERAAYERDVLPVLPESQVPQEDRHRWEVACRRRAERTGFSMGYFSGSITHNDDFEMILPAVVRFMGDYPDATLHVVGELDLPEELRPFEGRVVRMPFSPWRRLPQTLSFVDVNLVPLEDTLFNRAKSENKWVEAALVKVPSVASAVGALQDSITDGVDGVLCRTADEWYDALVRLHDSADLRSRLARAAYDECVAHHVTCGTGVPLANFIRGQERPNLAIVFPGLDVSGGVIRAAFILRKLELFAEFFNRFRHRLPQVQFYHAAAFVFQRLEITQRLGVAQLPEGVVLARDLNVFGGFGRQNEEYPVVAVAFMQLAAGVQVARTVTKQYGAFGAAQNFVAQSFQRFVNFFGRPQIGQNSHIIIAFQQGIKILRQGVQFYLVLQVFADQQRGRNFGGNVARFQFGQHVFGQGFGFLHIGLVKRVNG